MDRKPLYFASQTIQYSKISADSLAPSSSLCFWGEFQFLSVSMWTENLQYFYYKPDSSMIKNIRTELTYNPLSLYCILSWISIPLSFKEDRRDTGFSKVRQFYHFEQYNIIWTKPSSFYCIFKLNFKSFQYQRRWNTIVLLQVRQFYYME